ncbi:hypothetical protein ZIOFF_053398 [Zingiber officinale]|nr:hypothetical protein ZIOFF_053398 [Zingiber officinale]
MKRNRAELAPNREIPPGVPPAKSLWQGKDSTGLTMKEVGAAPAPTPVEKPAVPLDEIVGSAAAEPTPPTVAAVPDAVVDVEWFEAAEHSFGGTAWWWGVEEERLSGWFPFAADDFLCSPNRGSGEFGSLLWEEEDQDIWQLQHIHEIPSALDQ